MPELESGLLAERIEVIGLDHLYLTVKDLAHSEKFYDTVFGRLDFRKADTSIAGDPHRHYFNRIMQISIRQAKNDVPHDPYAPGLHHLCLQVADNTSVDRLYDLLREAGIKATAPAIYPQYSDDYYATFLTDPDGLRFEIVARRARRKLYAERWNELNMFLNPVQKIDL
jgi:glyoxylase I family protein